MSRLSDFMENMKSNDEVKYVKDDTEKEMLKQFRRQLSDVLRPNDSDVVLLKWLRAKNFNLRKCEDLFRENLRCRAVHRLDQIADNWIYTEVLEKYEFNNHLGFAKDGTPVQYIAFGRGDLYGFIMSLDVPDIAKYCSFVIEKCYRLCQEQSKQLGKDINEVTFIVDMEGFALRRAFYAGVLELGLDLFRMLQDHYPEIWKYVLIVNAPSYFHTAFNLVRPILRHTFLKDIHVASREQTAELLLKYVNADVLPAFLGGKRVDSSGNPMCSEFVKFGGRVPERYYLRNRSPLLPTDNGVETAWIPARGCYNVPLLVREAGSVIWIQVRSEGGSIFHTLLFRSFGEDPQNPDFPAKDEYLNEQDETCNVQLCSPYIHWQSHLSPVSNCFCAPWPGIYIFKFDNSYNWLSGRKLIYRLRITSPSI